MYIFVLVMSLIHEEAHYQPAMTCVAQMG